MILFGLDSQHNCEVISSRNFPTLKENEMKFPFLKIYFFTILFSSIVLSSCNDYDQSSGHAGVIRTDNSEYHIMVEKRYVSPDSNKNEHRFQSR